MGREDNIGEMERAEGCRRADWERHSRVTGSWGRGSTVQAQSSEEEEQHSSTVETSVTAEYTAAASIDLAAASQSVAPSGRSFQRSAEGSVVQMEGREACTRCSAAS